jgi:hypothetical protein
LSISFFVLHWATLRAKEYVLLCEEGIKYEKITIKLREGGGMKKCQKGFFSLCNYKK